MVERGKKEKKKEKKRGRKKERGGEKKIKICEVPQTQARLGSPRAISIPRRWDRVAL